MVASVAQVKSQASLSQVSFSAPHVSSRFSFINASLLNATTCFFANATLCSLAPIAGFVSNASGFGAYPNLMDITLEGRQCTDVTWLSDSAVYCAYPHAVSKALFTLNFTMTQYTANYSVIRTSCVSVLNLLFVPKSPLVNTSLFSAFHWPGDAAPFHDVVERYRRLGRASGEDVKPRR